jgi:hypothetical protein
MIVIIKTKIMFKELFCFFAGLAFFFSVTWSQPPAYALQAASGTYTAITGGTSVVLTYNAATNYDDGITTPANAIPIGFTFNYNGTNYTLIKPCANGWASFSTTALANNTDSWTNNLATGPAANQRPLIAPLWDDHNMEANGRVTYLLSGVSPNQVMTIQWDNARWDYNAPTGVMSFQIKLFETTNIIEFVYKQESGSIASNSAGASIGITGTTTGNNSYWSLSDAGTNPQLSATGETTTILSKPANGQIYRWIPYCTASATTTVERISNFTYNTINANSSSTAGYVNNTSTATTVNLTPTSSLPFSTTIASFIPTDQVVIFIDFNHNGDFSDPGETVFTSTTPLAQGSVSGTISIPALSSTVLQGPTRLRIRLHDTGNGPNATGCGSSAMGQVHDYTVNIQPCFAATITTQPPNTFICNGGSGSIPVVATGTGLTYQWQISTNGGSTWSNVPVIAPYSGVTSNALTITAATLSMSGYLYRVLINGICSPLTTSGSAMITINTPADITTNPAHTTVCTGKDVIFTAAASGSSPSYQWQLSTDNGMTYSNIPGATLTSLTLPGATTAINGNRYRAVATVTSCGSVNSTAAILTVNPLPVVTISAAPIVAIKPGVTTFLSAGSVPSAVSYAWALNGSIIPGANAHAITVSAANVGSYKVTVTDINGCQNTSAAVAITADPSDRFWIYPNSSTGKFQVRLYSPWLSDIRTVTIYNCQGAMVLRKEFTILSRYDQMDFDLSRFAPGVYNIHLVHRYVNKEVVGRVVIAR